MVETMPVSVCFWREAPDCLLRKVRGRMPFMELRGREKKEERRLDTTPEVAPIRQAPVT